MKKTLDFLVIGAARSGSTTLYELIKEHPQIHIPPGKELPFFNDTDTYKKGFEWYLKENFSDADSNHLWGTITPQYLYSRQGVSTAKTAERIKHDSPETKLIAILRHPIERTFSHYKLSKRRGVESREFDSAIDTTLSHTDIGKLRLAGNPDSVYLFSSEYGNNIAPYVELFGKEKLLVLFTEDLEKDPAAVLSTLFNFLDIDPAYKPLDVHKVSHKGGAQAKVAFLTPKNIAKIPGTRQAWRRLVPYHLRKRSEMALHRWNIKPDNSHIDKKSKVYKQLVHYFADDVKLLESLINAKTPWNDWD